MSTRDYLAELGEDASKLHVEVFDGMCDYSRSRFNRMDHAQQARYMATLRARRYYAVNGVTVHRSVFDALVLVYKLTPEEHISKAA